MRNNIVTLTGTLKKAEDNVQPLLSHAPPVRVGLQPSPLLSQWEVPTLLFFTAN